MATNYPASKRRLTRRRTRLASIAAPACSQQPSPAVFEKAEGRLRRPEIPALRRWRSPRDRGHRGDAVEGWSGPSSSSATLHPATDCQPQTTRRCPARRPSRPRRGSPRKTADQHKHGPGPLKRRRHRPRVKPRPPDAVIDPPTPADTRLSIRSTRAPKTAAAARPIDHHRPVHTAAASAKDQSQTPAGAPTAYPSSRPRDPSPTVRSAPWPSRCARPAASGPARRDPRLPDQRSADRRVRPHEHEPINVNPASACDPHICFYCRSCGQFFYAHQ